MTKVDKCRKFGANVVIHGAHIGESRDYAKSQYPDLRYINGYDDPEIIAGAGTMGLEILEQQRDVDAILVPVGGAGLIAGTDAHRLVPFLQKNRQLPYGTYAMSVCMPICMRVWSP